MSLWLPLPLGEAICCWCQSPILCSLFFPPPSPAKSLDFKARLHCVRPFAPHRSQESSDVGKGGEERKEEAWSPKQEPPSPGKLSSFSVGTPLPISWPVFPLALWEGLSTGSSSLRSLIGAEAGRGPRCETGNFREREQGCGCVWQFVTLFCRVSKSVKQRVGLS